jgi:DNA-binding XRE family transcriptional regulator
VACDLAAWGAIGDDEPLASGSEDSEGSTMSTEALAEHFGVNLERCRRRAELSQTELGARASLSRQAFGLIEFGQRKPYDGMAQKAAVRDWISVVSLSTPRLKRAEHLASLARFFSPPATRAIDGH